MAESLLWAGLRNRRLAGLKFRRQYPVGPYVLDFFCDEANLAVETDGASHDSLEAHRYDEKRDRFVEARGIRVLRFLDEEVSQWLDGVLAQIREAAGMPDEPEDGLK